MRLLFIVPGNGSRSNFVTGDLMRNGQAGLSGTDTSAILVAEYLASQGYEIVLAVEKSDEHLIEDRRKRGFDFIPGNVVRGVTYTYLDLENIENRTFDILVNCLWFGDYDKLPITVTKAVCYWCHLAWMYYLGELKDYALKHNLKVGYINISEWGKGHHQENIDFLKKHITNVEVVTLPNAMTTDVMQEVLAQNLERKSKKVIFPAQWSRGGDVALKAVRELGWEAEFKTFDYVNLSNGTDKQTLFTELATSDYFIFPQYSPNGHVYKDMHSCAVGEAIGMGVIVLSYPLGSHEEHYGGYYIKLDFPPDINMEKMMSERVTEESKMDYTENIVKIVRFLEDNAHIKEYMRKKGTPYILDTFNIEKIGPKWAEFLEKLNTEIVQVEKESSILSRSFYINLDHRTDRKEEFLQELKRVDLDGVQRLPGILLTEEENEEITKNGGFTWPEANGHLNNLLRSQRGCTLSHKEAVKKAKENNWKNVLIFEDDCVFIEDIKSELIKVEEFISTNDDWDMIFLGVNLNGPVEVYNDIFYKLGANFATAHSYIVNSRFYDNILDFSFNDYLINDVYYKNASREHTLLLTKKLLTTQRDGFSDNENRNMEYSYYIVNNFRRSTMQLNEVDVSKIGFFYQTANNPGCVEMNLKQIRKYYPNSPIAIWEDISDECKELCEKYNATYKKVHRLPSDRIWHRSQPITEISGGLHYLHRLYISCMTTLKNADWIVHYEDDVWCTGPITKLPSTEWGGTIRTGWNEELDQYLRESLGVQGALWHGACGGALIKREAIINSYLKLQEIDWVEVLKRDERVAMYSDYVTSFMLLLGGYKWSEWDNWQQGGYEDFKVYTRPLIHNIKYWYHVKLEDLETTNNEEKVKFFIEKNSL
jgi:GR25 family glycosyltransferase involved in LPS biosynthesis